MTDALLPEETPVDEKTTLSLRAAIEREINIHSAESGSDTPDFILAQYLTDCLEAFDRATVARERWYGRAP